MKEIKKLTTEDIVMFMSWEWHESWLQQLDYRIAELEKKHVGFEREIPEPQVAKSQQYLADRLSEAENSEDEHWLGTVYYGKSNAEVVKMFKDIEENEAEHYERIRIDFDKLTGSWGHKDPDGDDDVRGLA